MPIQVSELDPKDRQKSLVQAHVAKQKNFMVTRGRCDYCALLLSHCMCAKLEALALPEESLDFSVAVIMNTREKYRSSNTAKVIEKVLHGLLLVDGIDQDERLLEKLLARNANKVFVLFPSESSVEYSHMDASQFSEIPLILVPDGTWRQARRLNQKIPANIPRVRVAPQTLSRFLCRRQTLPDRVCTVEALALLMADMGKDRESKQLELGLATVVESFNLQCFGSTHRPNHMLKQLPQGKDLPPRHPDSLIS